MVTFRNNNGRRNTFRRNERNFKSNGERNKFNNNFSNSENFLRKAPGRNNQNASKLIEKYNNLAREALSGGDKILSENYFQHADHFTRIFNEKETQRKTIFKNQISENNSLSDIKEKNIENLSEKEQEKVENKHSEAN
tara:strand:+ start:140 stop:553 length:414 start_codon:yes stop_codon:yes gene_type:complete